MTPITITGPTGKTAVVSLVARSEQNDGSVKYAMAGRNGGRTKVFKTCDGAIDAANRYVMPAIR